MDTINLKFPTVGRCWNMFWHAPEVPTTLDQLKEIDTRIRVAAKAWKIFALIGFLAGLGLKYSSHMPIHIGIPSATLCAMIFMISLVATIRFVYYLRQASQLTLEQVRCEIFLDHFKKGYHDSKWAHEKVKQFAKDCGISVGCNENKQWFVGMDLLHKDKDKAKGLIREFNLKGYCLYFFDPKKNSVDRQLALEYFSERLKEIGESSRKPEYLKALSTIIQQVNLFSLSDELFFTKSGSFKLDTLEIIIDDFPPTILIEFIKQNITEFTYHLVQIDDKKWKTEDIERLKRMHVTYSRESKSAEQKRHESVQKYLNDLRSIQDSSS